MTKIGVVFIGLGYMGFRAYMSLMLITEVLKQGHQIEISLIIAIEPDEQTRKDFKRFFEALLIPFKMYSCLEEFFFDFNSLLGKTQIKHLIFYDASPTQLHASNLNRINGFKKSADTSINFYYFGEKPLSTDKEQLCSWLKEGEDKIIPFCCDFIELQNSAYLILKNYLDSVSFEIETLKFCRASCMGFEKLFKPAQRRGVTGGALEDKGIHDIVLTIDLFGGIENLKIKKKNGNGSCPIEGVTIKPDIECIYFMPDSIFSLIAPEPFFMTTTGEKPIKTIFEKEPIKDQKYWLYAADAQFKMQIDWYLKDGKKINTSYYFSWVGVPKAIKEEMGVIQKKAVNKKELEKFKWLGKKREEIDYKSPTLIGKVSYSFEETRIIIIEGKSKNKKEKIICNLLRKPDIGISEQWVYKFSDNKIEPIKIDKESFLFGQNALARMFYNVIPSFLGREKFHRKVGKKATCWAHLIIAEARKKAFDEILKSKNLERLAHEYMNKYKKVFSSKADFY